MVGTPHIGADGPSPGVGVNRAGDVKDGFDGGPALAVKDRLVPIAIVGC